MEQNIDALVQILDLCLNYNHKPSKTGEIPTHVKISSEIISSIFLVSVIIKHLFFIAIIYLILTYIGIFLS